MDLSGFDPQKSKKWLIWGTVIFVLGFVLFSFLASYYKYNTDGPISEAFESSYDESSFDRLHTELLRDRPDAVAQNELLQDIGSQRSSKPKFASTARTVYSEGSFDTLAVNCGVLLEKYKELAIKYHELKKQVDSKQRFTTSKGTRTGSVFNTRQAGGEFDYTKYIRAGASNELQNQTGSSPAGNRNFSWATLSMPQNQKVFDQSIVTFTVAEPFVLQDQTVEAMTKIEGVAQVSRGRGRIFVAFKRIYLQNETIMVEGEAFSLDKSRGINVFIHSESSLAQSLKREAGDLASLVDPTSSQVARSLIQDTDVGLEVFANLDAGTMVLANIRRR